MTMIMTRACTRIAAEAAFTIRNNLRFPGQYYDRETGLNYNYFRYYDPRTGRYTRTDPIGLMGGMNPYGYGLNNPLCQIDPLGLIYNTYSWKALGGDVLLIAGLAAIPAGAPIWVSLLATGIVLELWEAFEALSQIEIQTNQELSAFGEAFQQEVNEANLIDPGFGGT
jgi:RHS repeat-associated protein